MNLVLKRFETAEAGAYRTERMVRHWALPGVTGKHKPAIPANK